MNNNKAQSINAGENDCYVRPLEHAWIMAGDFMVRLYVGTGKIEIEVFPFEDDEEEPLGAVTIYRKIKAV